MKITLGLIAVFVVGYIVARFFPAPGNMIGLP
jgi:hypothetical protein